MTKIDIAERICEIIGDTYRKVEGIGGLIAWEPYEYLTELNNAPVLILDILCVPKGDYPRGVVINHLRGEIDFDTMLNILNDFKAEVMEDEK